MSSNENAQYINQNKLLEYFYETLNPIDEKILKSVIKRIPIKILKTNVESILRYIFIKMYKKNGRFYEKYDGICYYKKDNIIIPDYENKYIAAVILPLLYNKLLKVENDMLTKVREMLDAK